MAREGRAPLGMNVADEVNIFGQVAQHALAAVGTIASDDDGVVGKPGRRQFDEFDGQFRARAMIGIDLGHFGLGLALLAFRESLAIAIEPRATGRAKTLVGAQNGLTMRMQRTTQSCPQLTRGLARLEMSGS